MGHYPRRNILQVFLVLGEEFLLLQLVFLKGQFLIRNESTVKIIDRQDKLVIKPDRVLRLIHPLKCKVYSIQGSLDLPRRFLVIYTYTDARGAHGLSSDTDASTASLFEGKSAKVSD